jgi:hypothetical protein
MKLESGKSFENGKLKFRKLKSNVPAGSENMEN